MNSLLPWHPWGCLALSCLCNQQSCFANIQSRSKTWPEWTRGDRGSPCCCSMCLIGLFGDYSWKQSLDSWLLRKVGGSTWIQHHTLLSTNLQDTCFRWTELFLNSVSIRQAESWRENGVWKPSFQALLSNSVCLCFYSVLSPDHLVSLKRWPLKKKKKKTEIHKGYRKALLSSNSWLSNSWNLFDTQEHLSGRAEQNLYKFHIIYICWDILYSATVTKKGQHSRDYSVCWCFYSIQYLSPNRILYLVSAKSDAGQQGAHPPGVPGIQAPPIVRCYDVKTWLPGKREHGKLLTDSDQKCPVSSHRAHWAVPVIWPQTTFRAAWVLPCAQEGGKTRCGKHWLSISSASTNGGSVHQRCTVWRGVFITTIFKIVSNSHNWRCVSHCFGDTVLTKTPRPTVGVGGRAFSSPASRGIAPSLSPEGTDPLLCSHLERCGPGVGRGEGPGLHIHMLLRSRHRGWEVGQLTQRMLPPGLGKENGVVGGGQGTAPARWHSAHSWSRGRYPPWLMGGHLTGVSPLPPWLPLPGPQSLAQGFQLIYYFVGGNFLTPIPLRRFLLLPALTGTIAFYSS